MPLKNSNAVAVERRTDLASLFCMIGRHGPAVVLAVVAVVSMLAAFVIYRTVRGKRRKATAAAAASDSGRPAEERGASVSRPEHEPNPEESFGSTDSTDVSDEGSSDGKEEAYLIQSHPTVRQRCVAANGKKGPPPCSSAHSGCQVVQEDKKLKDKNDVEITDKDVSEKQNKPEAETLQCVLNSPVHFDQTLCLSENIDDTLQDTEPTPMPDSVELGLEKSVIRHSKDEKAQSLHSHSIDHSTRARKRQLCPEEERKDGESDAVASVHCGDEQVKESESKKSDENNLLGIASDSKTQGVADFKDCEPSQSDKKDDRIAPSLDKDARLNILGADLTCCEKEIQSGHVVALAEDPQPQDLQDQQNSLVMSNGHFDSPWVATALVTCAGDDKPDKNVTASDAWLACQDQQSDSTGTNKAFNKTQVDSATDACDKVTVGGPTMSEGMSHPHMSTCQGQRSDVSEVTSGVINPPISKINPLSFEQSGQTENNEDGVSSPGGGVESGISSMAVSPDLQVSANELHTTLNVAIFPAMDYYALPEKRAEAQNSLIADDPASSVTNEKAGVELESYLSVHSQKPPIESTDWAEYESAAANEDVFGHEVDDSYHNALDQYMEQIAASVTRFTSEPEETTHVKDAAEGAEITEGSGVSVQKKKMMPAEEENEEEFEKTEISIMEATMDNNEWITDSNYQVLPWMNVCVSPFAQDNQKPRHLPTEADNSALRDAAREDTDTPPSTEVKPKHALSLGEESKKVVAVQPMPQNVNVTFRIHYVTRSPYQTVAVTGNQRELGNWKEFIPLERAKDGHWATVVSLPAETHVEWKFVLLDKGEVCRWEECGNRLLDTGFGDDVTVHKWWGLL